MCVFDREDGAATLGQTSDAASPAKLPNLGLRFLRLGNPRVDDLQRTESTQVDGNIECIVVSIVQRGK